MPDTIVTLNQTLLGKPIVNVTSWNNFIEDSGFLQSFADIIRGQYVFHISDNLSTAWTLEDITVSFLDADSVTYSVTVPFTDGPLSGADPGEVLPTQSALLVSTSHIGPKPNRGKFRVSGFSEAAQANSLWNAGVLDNAKDMIDEWAQGLQAQQNTVFLRILRRPSDVFPSYVSSQVDLVGITPQVRNLRSRQLPSS